MKKRITIAISFIMVIVLGFSAVGCTNFSNVSEETISSFENATLEVFEEPVVESEEVENGIEKPIKMRLNSTGTTTYTNNYLSQTIVATVFPESASNKEIIWTIEWETPSYNNEIQDIEYYFDVVPTYEGSNVAEVRCYHEPCFADNYALITATTAEGGFTASCSVRYVGYPSQMDVTSDALEKDDDGNYLIPIGSDLTPSRACR